MVIEVVVRTDYMERQHVVVVVVFVEVQDFEEAGHVGTVAMSRLNEDLD